MSRPVSFVIVFPEVTLSVDEVWPNGDAPENPTAQDVVNAMRESGGYPGAVMTDWGLSPSEIEVFGNHDASRATFS